MGNVTILFESITAAQKAHDTLQSMIDTSIDCNALTYSELDEELVKWLVRDKSCRVGAKKRVYIYPVEVISKSSESTLYQYHNLQIEQIFIPPADWEFVTKNSRGEIIDWTWWGYEDGCIDIEIYIENFVERCEVEQ